MKTLTSIFLSVAFLPSLVMAAADCSQADKGLVKIIFQAGEAGPSNYKQAIDEAYTCFRTAHARVQADLDIALKAAEEKLGPGRCHLGNESDGIVISSWNTGRPSPAGEATGEEAHVHSQKVICRDDSTGMFSGIVSTVQFVILAKRKVTDIYGHSGDGTTEYELKLVTNLLQYFSHNNVGIKI